ncbi:hypothetical protein M406DRAFT_248389 [Cryphonectria parasitica EP155]|uniref:Protein FAF1 n=1 Tax=Cryphonectria parasitica (strain ATCC 38755 / EP155) TaxID=660469 RepID=A0A9P4YAU1_CRYP1|nr:uncharacterized protein M406DRAFT_248389 [Cryphonectria parasitica EP155]KAF3770107.1 hypothetical protein M406DRAFT_248389 [Cryphonectria parasitica EP155]
MPSAAVLGKRKRRPAQKAQDETDAAALEDVQAIFRKHFEAQFAPLDDEVEEGTSTKDEEGDEDGIEDMRSDSSGSGGDDDDVDEWGGLSGEDDSESADSDGGDDEGSEASDNSQAGTSKVEVVDHSRPLAVSALHPSNAIMSKREMRAFLSSRPPEPDLTSKPKTKPGDQEDDNDDPQNEDSKTLLANDLALQRLISESHILSASNPFNSVGSSGLAGGGGVGGKTFTQGRTRALTTDLRIQKLGSKESIFTQRKMPMGMRKGINAAKDSKEAKRRREAKENGIILEKPVDKAGKKKGRSKGRGGLAVDMPGMGRFSGGELKLSKREVRAVEMEGKKPEFGRKRRRRR